MTPFRVVLVPFPFADLSSSKRRPCLVLSSFSPRSLGEHLIVAMMTSQIDGLRFPHDIEVRDLSAAKLPKPTLIRLCKLVTIEAKLVTKHLGELSAADRKAVRQEFNRLFSNVAA